MKKVKGACCQCHRLVSVNRNGKASRHGYKRFRQAKELFVLKSTGYDGMPCSGSGKRVVGWG